MAQIRNECGFEVIQAGTGVEALEICRKNSDIDLVLMDINLPELDSLTATRQIHICQEALPHLKSR